MPNRVLRDGILRSERVDRLSPGAEIFYRRLMSVVDDYGRYYASPKLLNADCYPLKEESVPVEEYLTECSAGDQPLVIVYTVAGKRYLEIQEFQQRQRSDSKFPAPTRTAIATPPPVSAPPSRDSHSPSSASALPPHDGNARPLRAGAVGGEGEAVFVVEGGDAHPRTQPPPPLPTERSASELAEIGKLLQMAMRPGTPAPDGHLVSQVVAVLQGATLPELAAAILQRRSRTRPPESYGFWPIYLQDALAPNRRGDLGAIPVATKPEPQPAEPSCSDCGGTGVVGATVGVSCPKSVRLAIAGGAKLCTCDHGGFWADWFEMDQESGAYEDIPVVRHGAGAGYAAVAR